MSNYWDPQCHLWKAIANVGRSQQDYDIVSFDRVDVHRDKSLVVRCLLQRGTCLDRWHCWLWCGRVRRVGSFQEMQRG